MLKDHSSIDLRTHRPIPMNNFTSLRQAVRDEYHDKDEEWIEEQLRIRNY